MWFHCRDMPSDTPRLLMRRAKMILARDLAALYPIYLRAIVRSLRALAREKEKEREGQDQGTGEGEGEGEGANTASNSNTAASARGNRPEGGGVAGEGQGGLEEEEEELDPVAQQQAGREGRLTVIGGLKLEQWDFVTGLVGLNRIASRICELSDEKKRKMLFGSDQLVP
jgi:hypothetical protein